MDSTVTGASQLQQNATYTAYTYIIIVILVAFVLYKIPDVSTFLGILAGLSATAYVYYRTWRYVPR